MPANAEQLARVRFVEPDGAEHIAIVCPWSLDLIGTPDECPMWLLEDVRTTIYSNVGTVGSA